GKRPACPTTGGKNPSRPTILTCESTSPAIIDAMTHSIIAGAEPWSHVANGQHGAVVLHGFTGNPASMRGVAEALADAGFHVELPLLPGHGTRVEDMLATRWADWAGEAEEAYQRLSQ